ncbi:MAG: ferredoxin [Sulfuricurvum sp. GWF2_44_89]|uniref:Ferredoxin n=1 Tax=Sulfuricurvum kujiense TaxID=148813 RepID=A0A2D3WBF3_9BACT|nr:MULTISPECIES: NADH-quinone oxidoreductase subunit G [Sulfuricurvum]OHD78183.1 MAG: ferredoxin [Sulfuricurvum sp. GWF2_44_89]OHD91396.1 MAG: ferredoxin [Sulfuricurvum sp. RIFOXYD12_FULL_44_77]OHD92143.1 MAG: ferredoxin [Sulfuricurvum sp. RIFOXYD2_FULL_44_160]DAB38641.1 MAG TPA: ferredoxin [Sulfuricurvum kujiense]
MNEITITIDGRSVQTQEGEYILNAARANGIFIPAICYLTRCSPTLACRICLVEADGKQVYACNAKAKEGMDITTTTPNILAERRAIMEVYDVNHPLECGVCDQSGECELQNYTLEVGVDSQTYSIKDTHKPAQNWGLIHYDPALCIMCERCITVCKDMIGDAALSTVARGSEAIEAEFKESMPKDAYAMWNKLNKSLIAPNGGDRLDCTDCGECSSVCPVGALVSSDYQYTSNAWEHKQIPATCAHCSAGCQLSYDIKHTSITDPEAKIYRVKNEWNYVSLCGAGRYGYDFENRDVVKNAAAFDAAVTAFKKADTIAFTSTITNEEALILQRLKVKYGYRLVNNEALALKNFLSSYSTISGKSLYGGDLKQVHESDFVVSIGSALKTDNPNARFAMNNAFSMNKGAGLYFHPINDPVIADMSKNVTQFNHAPMMEEAALYLMLDLFGDKAAMPSSITEYLATFHSMKTITVEETVDEKVTETVVKKVLNEESGIEEEVTEEVTKTIKKKVSKEVEVDENALFALVSAPAGFADTLAKYLAKKETFSLMVGPDLYTHPHSENCARLVALIEKYTPFSVTMIPNLSNTLGVAMICDLDGSRGNYTIGYNIAGDFTLSALGNGDLDMPALNQQEGTLTSIDKRVNPTNAALGYGGYVLNDLANALGVNLKFTVDYTAQLPVNRGFKAMAFDTLPNNFTNTGEEVRGYLLENIAVSVSGDENVTPFNADSAITDKVVYLANPVLQFSPFTAMSHQLKGSGGLYVSASAMESNGWNEGDMVNVKTARGEVRVSVITDGKIEGDISYLPTFDTAINSEALFDGYRFACVSIQKV